MRPRDLWLKSRASSSVERRCRNCWYSATEPLPLLAKKVLYLDQFVLSNMAMSLDALWQAERNNTPPPIWLRLFGALDRAVRLQLPVCPVSRIHEQESIVPPHFAMVRRIYEHLSGEVEFEWPPHSGSPRQVPRRWTSSGRMNCYDSSGDSDQSSISSATTRTMCFVLAVTRMPPLATA